MADYERIYEADGISIDEWRCRGRAGGEKAREVNPEHTFAFPLQGAFRKHLGGREGVATPGTVLFFRRGEEYRTTHPIEGGDHGLALRVDGELLRRILDELGRDDPEPTAETAIAPATALRLRELLLASRGSPPPPELEEMALGLIGELLERGADAEGQGGGERTVRRHRRAVSRVLELCAARFREPLTLEEIAGETDYSPFYLSRVFKRATGVTIFRHVNRLRLIAALDRAGSIGELSQLALGLGYSSHSHFTAAFRRELGAPPSKVFTSLLARRRN
ncbi:MAG: AraC family transcriptional regulator [Gemmatimonadota bacterium]|nr:AraC family transcriptional regulator [Gemmatimonadota bacterium]